MLGQKNENGLRRVSRWRWIAVVAGIAFGAFSAYQLWPRIVELLTPQQAARVAPAPIQEIVAPPREEFTSIDPKVARLGTDSSLSKVPLSLVLVAVTPGRNAGEGSAALGTDPRNPQVYAAGALLENGARLTEIHSDHVVLERAGVRASLFISNGDVAAAPPIDSKSLAPKRHQTSDREDELLRVGGQAETSLVRGGSTDLIEEALRAQNFYESSKLTGFQVFPGSRASVFSQLGLQAGDVITGINGQRITDDDQWREMSEALLDGAAVSVAVTRNGELTHVALDGAIFVDHRQ